MVSHDLLPAKSGIFLDAAYVLLYIQTFIWLATQPAEMLGTILTLAHWITNILKIEPDDSPEIADQKTRTYAQINCVYPKIHRFFELRRS
jgi:hypothetical protein